jgi:colicin import membrane protein
MPSLAQNDCRGERGFMARKLKTYQTSLGFFDLAIAAPSMKAALKAWGADSNLFHQGVAKESDDPVVVAATLSKPGVILRRPVGSDGPFREHADLPRLSGNETRQRMAKTRANPKRQQRDKPDSKTARQAALEYERAEKLRESERRKEESARRKQRERRERAVAKVQAALEKAQREHVRRSSTIEAERSAVEKRSQAEDVRWEKQKRKLESELRRARDSE